MSTMREKKEGAMREALADMFEMLAYKVKSGNMTADDVRSVVTALEAGGGVKATVKDLAGYYGKKEVDVRNVLHRGYSQRPVRRAYYDFGAFRDIVPKKWCATSSLPTD